MIDNDRPVACDVGLRFVFDGSISTTTNVSSRTAHHDRISLSLSHALTASHLFSSQILGHYILTQNTSLFRPVLSNCLCAWLLFSSRSSNYTLFSYDLLANPEKGGGKSLRNTDVFLPYHTTHITSQKAVVFLLSVVTSPNTISLLTNSDAATYGF